MLSQLPDPPSCIYPACYVMAKFIRKLQAGILADNSAPTAADQVG